MSTAHNLDGLQVIIDSVLHEMKCEQGSSFNLSDVNLADFARRCGISRSKARTLKKHGFRVRPHANLGTHPKVTKMTGFTDLINGLLSKGVTNSVVIFERACERGYEGSLSTIKSYIAAHKTLVPVRRPETVAQGNRGRRYSTDPGHSYQMDWGFVNVEREDKSSAKYACFAMICHHCATFYVEFFTSASQENLFIGMLHAFSYMGIPETVLTDNMKSVVTSRDQAGHPIFNEEYALFQSDFGFTTKLCKVAHPYTKGKVERLVQFVKNNFLAARVAENISDLNRQARQWSESKNHTRRAYHDFTPAQEHEMACMKVTRDLNYFPQAQFYLCPVRKISPDGFITYEGRRFGVPYRYTQSSCRVCRLDEYIHIFSMDFSEELTVHPVTWSREDSYCRGQFSEEGPVEKPSQTVTHSFQEIHSPNPFASFSCMVEEAM